MSNYTSFYKELKSDIKVEEYLMFNVNISVSRLVFRLGCLQTTSSRSYRLNSEEMYSICKLIAEETLHRFLIKCHIY